MNKVRINNKKGLLRKEFLAILFIVGLYVSCISIFDQDQMSLILPTLCLVSIMLYLTFKLMRIENRIPIFDAGYFMIGITFLYMFYPYISFMLSGFDWSITSDSRLKGAGADSKSLGSFAWYHVSYLLALTAGYLFFRPTSPIKHLKKDLVIKQFEVKVALVVLIGIILYEILVPIVFGESPPYFFLQLSNMLGSVKFVFTIFFIAFCLSHWKIKIMPLILFGYLGYEVFNIFIGEAGRTWVFLHFCAFVLLYDRLVSPMTLKQIIIIGLIAIVAFLALGFF